MLTEKNLTRKNRWLKIFNVRQNFIKKSHETFDGVPFKYDQESEIISFGQFENDGEDSEVRISKLPTLQKRRDSRTYVFINA